MLKWLKSFFTEKVEEVKELQIWGILQGPIRVQDMPEEEVPDDVTDDSVYMVMKFVKDNRVLESEFWFDNMKEAMSMVSYFNNNIEPITLKIRD